MLNKQKESMPKFFKILPLFLVWRIGLFLVAFLSIFLFPVFGSRFPYYKELLISTGFPYWVWGFGNFDGVHYLNIAQAGYFAKYSQAFFPLYPLLIRLFSFGSNFFLVGLIISNVFFLLSLYSLFKLYKLDYKNSVCWKALILLIVFPTAFYFVAIYTESLFLFLTTLSIYLIRRRSFFGGGLLAFFAGLTRLVGGFLFLVALIELIVVLRNRNFKKTRFFGVTSFMGLFLSLSGVLTYMFYLKVQFNDPLYFLNAQSFFGAQRSSSALIFLPQVLFRYIKILYTVSINSVQFWNAALEFFSTIFVFIVIMLNFKKIRLSYLLFMLGCLVLPTLTGTLSSMPRYLLMLFPALPVFILRSGRFFYPLIFVSIVLQVILLSMFIRGYWVA